MKKILALLLAVIIMALSQPVFASERKWADNSLENMDGLAAKFGIIHLADNKNHATRDTHGWLIIDAEIINYAIENLIIEDVLSAQLIYQDKYVFTAQTDFSQKVIQPLVSLKGRLIFEVPVLVYESTPENFKIEIFIEGEVYPFLIPAAGNDTALDDKSFEPIEVGTKGALVLAVQEKLVKMGLISGTPDGHYGNYTAGAVKELQRRHGMPQTGICDYDFLVNVLEIDPDEVSVIPVSKPDIKIESSVYQQDGMTIINDSNITFKWMSEGQVESYAVNLLYEDGTRFSLGTAKDTSKTVPTWQLQPGLYKLFVGATPMGGTSEDTVWNELCFSVPGSNSAE